MGKCEFSIKRWEGMRKVHPIMYFAVNTETARGSAPLRLLKAGVHKPEYRFPHICLVVK